MRTFNNNLMTILTIGALCLGTSAFACGGGGGGGGYKFKHGGGYGGYHNNHKVYVKKVYVAPAYDHCSHPRHSFCYVLPGDTWYTIAQREYGNSSFCHKIASYNQLSFGATLLPGQQIRLPSIYASGRLIASSAPAPQIFAPQGGSFAPQGQLGLPQGQPGLLPGQPAAIGSQNFGPQGMPQNGQGFAPQGAAMGAAGQSMAPQGPGAQPGFGGQQGFNGPQVDNSQQAAPQNGPNAQTISAAMPVTQAAAESATPAANIRVASEEPTLPNVTIGSVLMLEGQLLGEEKGSVRLRISGMALPVEVLEWTISSAKVRLPEMDLNEGMRAEIEVLRADGSLASKSAIRLTPAATRLALGN